MSRIAVEKTWKLYVNGAFVRSESGRTIALPDHKGHVCRASRKDFRSAVEAARHAQAGWARLSAYNRGQILYRMAEMAEGKREELAEAILVTRGAADRRAAREEVEASIDRLVSFAGWTDKYVQVLGGQNPVAGPYYNFTVPEPVGVVVAIAPDAPPLLGFVSLIAPLLCAGNTAIAIIGAEHPLAASLFAEVAATSDLPAGVLGILTGDRAELLPHVASHREVDAVAAAAAGLSADEAEQLRLGSAESVKRVRIIEARDREWFDAPFLTSPWMIEPFVEMKTIWHPSAT